MAKVDLCVFSDVTVSHEWGTYLSDGEDFLGSVIGLRDEKNEVGKNQKFHTMHRYYIVQIKGGSHSSNLIGLSTLRSLNMRWRITWRAKSDHVHGICTRMQVFRQ